MPLLGKIPEGSCYHNNSSSSKDKSACRDGENSSVFFVNWFCFYMSHSSTFLILGFVFSLLMSLL